MTSDDERREVAARLRKATGLHEFAEVLGFDWTDDSDWVWNDVSNLVADLIEPEPERTWHDFSDELPPVGVSVLCRGKNGALYVGKPVTFKGNVTCKVWVPRGDQYRTPEKWMEVSA